MKRQRSRGKKVLVIGDLIIDAYHHGSYLGQSVDSVKTPVALESSVTRTWGGSRTTRAKHIDSWFLRFLHFNY